MLKFLWALLNLFRLIKDRLSNKEPEPIEHGEGLTEADKAPPKKRPPPSPPTSII